MSKQSAEPGYFNITSEHFALERAELTKERELVLVKHALELQEFDRQFDRIARLEEDVAALAVRHAKRPKKSGVDKPKGKRSTPSRPVPSGKPWTPEEDERVLRADDAGLHAIAEMRNTTFSAIKARRSILLKRRVRIEEPAVSPEPLAEEPAPWEPSSSENPEIFEPTSEERHYASIFDDHRATERKPPERGTPVRGIMENGPEDRREYGRGFESAGRE